jgi:hypothetical protein
MIDAHPEEGTAEAGRERRMGATEHGAGRRAAVVRAAAGALPVVLGLAWWLLPVTAGVAFAQEVPDPGPPADAGGGGVDLGPLLGGIGHLAEMIGQGFSGLGHATQWVIAYLPRLIITALFAVFGLLALGLMKVFNLGDLGTLLVQTPLAAFQVPWMQQLVLTLKATALLLLAPMLAWSGAGISLGALEDDLGDLLKRFFIGAVLVASIDVWNGLAIQGSSALAVAAAGDAAVPGLQDATAMAAQATVVLPVPVEGLLEAPTAAQIEAGTTEFFRQAEMLAARGIVSLLWAVAGVFAGAAALARLGWLQALYLLAPVAVVFYVAPVGGLIARVWAVAFFGALFIQIPAVLLLRIGATGAASFLLPSQADQTSGWGVVTGVVVFFVYTGLIAGSVMHGAWRGVTATRRTARAARMIAVAAAPVAVAGTAVALSAAGRVTHIPQLQAAGRALAAPPPPPAPPPGQPTMITHSHTHGHLVGRETGVPAAGARRSKP